MSQTDYTFPRTNLVKNSLTFNLLGRNLFLVMHLNNDSVIAAGLSIGEQSPAGSALMVILLVLTLGVVGLFLGDVSGGKREVKERPVICLLLRFQHETTKRDHELIIVGVPNRIRRFIKHYRNVPAEY